MFDDITENWSIFSKNGDFNEKSGFEFNSPSELCCQYLDDNVEIEIRLA